MQASEDVRTVPASFFGIVLGVSGLGAAWRNASRVWGVPHIVGELILLFGAMIWAALILMYARKWVVAREAAITEANHPVQCCFIGLIGVATMLIGGAVLPYSRPFALILYAAGAIFTGLFALWRTGVLWQGNREVTSTTAVLYLPAVAGSFVMGTVAAALGFQGWGQYAFGAGLFTWFAIESVLLNRLYTAPEIPSALRPTMGVQLAPPAVGAVSYLSVTSGAPGIFAHALIGYALLQALLLLRLLPWIWKDSFTPSYWAFSFGITALANAPLIMIERGDNGPIDSIAPSVFVIANAIILFMALATLTLLLKDRLFPRLQVAQAVTSKS